MTQFRGRKILDSRRVIQTAKVIGIQTHTDLIKEFYFEMQHPANLKFRAGQFLMIHIASPTPGAKDLLRAYSLASGEEPSTSFRLLVKYVDEGVASRYFWDLKEGDTVKLTAPFGKLFFPDAPSEKLFFLSTGSGLAPHLSYIETFLDRYPNCSFHFMIGVRTQRDFFYMDYLNEKKKTFKNFDFEFVLSRPDDNWKGRAGYLQKQVETLKFDVNNSHFFICGNKDMANATKHALLDQGLAANKILVEIF